MSKQHVTWSRETHDLRCPGCGGETVLVIFSQGVEVDEASTTERIGPLRYEELFSCGLDLNDELTGHVCADCEMLCSLSLNTAT